MSKEEEKKVKASEADEKAHKEAEEKKKKEDEAHKEAHKKEDESEEKKKEANKKEDESEEKKKEAAKKEDESEEKKREAAKHDDAAADAELFKKLLKDHLGESESENEEAMKMAKKIHKEAIKRGMKQDEAMKCAGYGIKAAAMYGESMSEADEADEKKEASATSPGGNPGETGPNLKNLESQVVKLTAENAALKETAKKAEIETHLDKVLRESGLSTSATKAFRKLVEGKKDTKQIDEAFETYREAFKTSGGGSQSQITSFAFAMEKANPQSRPGSGAGFGDCIKQ